MNYKSVAIKVGDLAKYATTLNEINRSARSIFNFSCEKFPIEDGITSERAVLFYNWVMTLAKQKMNNEERNNLLTKFCNDILFEEQITEMNKIFESAGIKAPANQELLSEFHARGFHEEINKHSKKSFRDGSYFHAVSEAAKAYTKSVREKSKSNLDGQALMLSVWGWEKGVLKITACESETDKNIQEGMKFLSAGLVGLIRNPTAHEPATDLEITKDECLDILNFISFLFKKLEKSVYYNFNNQEN